MFALVHHFNCTILMKEKVLGAILNPAAGRQAQVPSKNMRNPHAGAEATMHHMSATALGVACATHHFPS